MKSTHTDVGNSHMYYLGSANWDLEAIVKIDNMDSLSIRISNRF